MQLTTHTFMTSITASGASATYLTDYRFNDIPERTIQGVLTGGSSVNLYTYMNSVDETVEHLVSTFTSSSFTTVIQGPVAKIKIEKANGTGVAWIEGLV